MCDTVCVRQPDGTRLVKGRNDLDPSRFMTLVNNREVRECRSRRDRAKEWDMVKVIECNQVVPESGCDHVVRGATEEAALRNAADHAKQHGIVEVTPELMAKVKAAMHDE